MGDFPPRNLARNPFEKNPERKSQSTIISAILEICAKGIYVDNRDLILYFLGFALFFDSLGFRGPEGAAHLGRAP